MVSGLDPCYRGEREAEENERRRGAGWAQRAGGLLVIRSRGEHPGIGQVSVLGVCSLYSSRMDREFFAENPRDKEKCQWLV